MSEIVLTVPMEKAAKKEPDGEHPASHYLVVGDPSKEESWHLPYKTTGGAIDKRRLGAAWAALHGGFRGNKYGGPDRSSALARLKSAYKEAGMEPPDERNEDLKKAILADPFVIEYLRKDYQQGTQNLDMSLPAQAVEMNAEHDKAVRLKHAEHGKMMSDRDAQHQRDMDEDDANHRKNISEMAKDLPPGHVSDEMKQAQVDHEYKRTMKEAAHRHGGRLLDAEHQKDVEQMRADHLRKCGMNMSLSHPPGLYYPTQVTP